MTPPRRSSGLAGGAARAGRRTARAAHRTVRHTVARVATRSAALLATVTVLVLGVFPASAFAAAADSPGTARPLGAVNTVLIFAVGPIGVFLLVAAIVLRPGTAPKAARYRPGRDWDAAPTWIGTPQTPAGDSDSSAKAPDAGGASGSW